MNIFEFYLTEVYFFYINKFTCQNDDEKVKILFILSNLSALYEIETSYQTDNEHLNKVLFF